MFNATFTSFCFPYLILILHILKIDNTFKNSFDFTNVFMTAPSYANISSIVFFPRRQK